MVAVQHACPDGQVLAATCTRADQQWCAIGSAWQVLIVLLACDGVSPQCVLVFVANDPQSCHEQKAETCVALCLLLVTMCGTMQSI
jgi:hypothetical protein